jgi:hypothetical protein
MANAQPRTYAAVAMCAKSGGAQDTREAIELDLVERCCRAGSSICMEEDKSMQHRGGGSLHVNVRNGSEHTEDRLGSTPSAFAVCYS